MPEVGSIIAGKYRVVRQIGAGGMGTVVAAEHVTLGTPLALKFLSEKVKDSSSSLERFTREARACAALRSQHVCRVTDFGVDGDVPYIAMELLEGTDLARVVERGALDVPTAAEYVLQACVGLAEAHAAGIVHRDLKPHNLFLAHGPDGSPLVKVLDFGIAKIPVADSHALTRTAHVVGSPGYMAPEQLRSSKTVDTRADIWALGVILYELASGRHPFRADAVTEIALKIAMDEPPPLTEASALEPVVMKCLAKEPDERFQDVAALAAALAPLSSNAATAATVSRILGDPSDLRRTTPHLPTSGGSRDAETVREMPSPRAKLPETTQQHGSGMVGAKPPGKRRAAVFAIGGLVVAGGIAAAVMASNRATTEERPDATTITATIPSTDAPTATDAARSIDAAGSRADPSTTKTDPYTIPRPGPGSSVKPDDLRAPTGAAIRRGAEIDALRVQAKAAHSEMVKRGLLPSDLGPAGGDEDAIVGALARGDTATAKMAVDRLTQTIPTIKIDRAFIQQKIRRVDSAMRGIELTADRKKGFEDQLAEVLREVGDGNFSGANRRLNLIAAALARPTKANPSADDLLRSRRPTPGKPAADPASERAEAERIAREKDRAGQIRVLLDRILNARTQDVDITSACYSLANLDRDRVPFDRCVMAMCKSNPAAVGTLIALAPFNQQEGLRGYCRTR